MRAGLQDLHRLDASNRAAARRIRSVAPAPQAARMADWRLILWGNGMNENDDEAFAEARLIEAIENQLEAGEPPAAQATFNKLTLVGYEREEILALMAQVLAQEIRSMLRDDRGFDGAWYEQALRALPELPEED